MNKNNTKTKSDNPVPAVVLHLVDPDSRASASLDLCLERLAVHYRGTKFLRAGGHSTTLLLDAELAARAFRSPRKLQPETDLPALVAIRVDGVAVNTLSAVAGIDENTVSGSDNNNEAAAEVVDSAVEDWLHHSGVLIQRANATRGRLSDSSRRGGAHGLFDHDAWYEHPTKKMKEPRFDCAACPTVASRFRKSTWARRPRSKTDWWFRNRRLWVVGPAL